MHSVIKKHLIAQFYCCQTSFVEVTILQVKKDTAIKMKKRNYTDYDKFKQVKYLSGRLKIGLRTTLKKNMINI